MYNLGKPPCLPLKLKSTFYAIFSNKVALKGKKLLILLLYTIYWANDINSNIEEVHSWYIIYYLIIGRYFVSRKKMIFESSGRNMTKRFFYLKFGEVCLLFFDQTQTRVAWVTKWLGIYDLLSKFISNPHYFCSTHLILLLYICTLHIEICSTKKPITILYVII